MVNHLDIKGGGCDHKCHFRIIPFPTRLLLLPMFPMWNFYRRWSYYPAQSFCTLPIPSASSSSSSMPTSTSTLFIKFISIYLNYQTFIIYNCYHLSFIIYHAIIWFIIFQPPKLESWIDWGSTKIDTPEKNGQKQLLVIFKCILQISLQNQAPYFI